MGRDVLLRFTQRRTGTVHHISTSVGLLLLIMALSTNRDLLAQESVEQSAFLNRWTEALESVSQRVAPSVVRIFVSRRLLPLIAGGSSNSLTREHSSGSGVIVSEDLNEVIRNQR